MADIEQRARFEAWAKSEGYLTVKSHDGRYLAPETNSAEQGWQAALASQPQAPAAAVPDGFVLVPLEPTDEMLVAAYAADTTRAPNLSRWRAMLAAAPAPEVSDD